LSNEIIFVNPTAKPTRPTAAPTPEAPAEAQASQVKRIRIGWGEEGRKGIAAQSEAISLATADKQPQRELVKVRRTVSKSRSFSEAPSRIEMGRVERYSKLERGRRRRSLSEKLDQGFDKCPTLDHLTILHSLSTQQHWIADAETGKVFLHQPFTTLKHCHEAAVELEHTFDMEEVLMLRPPETLEQIQLLVQAHCQREKTEIACRQLLQIM
jgi:hypothetical protein